MAALPPGLTPPPKQPMRVAHRALGLFGALFLVLLIGTGIALQHPQQFALNSSYITSAWLLDWYGITAPPARVFEAGEHRVARIGELSIIDGNVLDVALDDLLGVVAAGEALVLLAPADLLLITPDGAVIDRIALPAPASGLGVTAAAEVRVMTTTGVLALSDDLIELQSTTSADAITWVSPITPEFAEGVELTQRYRTRLISVERFLLDLHSGRLFGRYGTWFVDLGALFVLALAVTGLLLARRR